MLSHTILRLPHWGRNASRGLARSKARIGAPCKRERMTWEALLERFRAAGGVAENVRLGDGAWGRGIFPIDPVQPVILHAPHSLFVPLTAIAVRDGSMTAKPPVSDAARDVFDAYQRSFGWGAGGLEQSRAVQSQWHALPDDVASAIKAISGVADFSDRFAPPTIEACMNDYLQARVFDRESHLYVVPMIELVNHASTAPSYYVEAGIGVRGTFAGEVLVSYNATDAWGMLLSHSFSAPNRLAYSVGVRLKLPGGAALTIGREIRTTVKEDQVALPALQNDADGLSLPFLLLGFTGAPDLPRGIFRHVMRAQLNSIDADAVFDGIAQFNRVRFLALLRRLRSVPGELARTMEEAIFHQLEALAAAVGARSIG